MKRNKGFFSRYQGFYLAQVQQYIGATKCYNSNEWWKWHGTYIIKWEKHSYMEIGIINEWVSEWKMAEWMMQKRG